MRWRELRENTSSPRFGLTTNFFLFHWDYNSECCGEDILIAIYQIFPDCIIIQGATRTPRHQGSVERGNRQIKDMLDAFETYERSNNNPDVQWPSLLPRIMVALNSEPKKTNLGGAFSEVAPYFAVFGQTWNGPFLQHKLDVADMRKYKTAAERVVATREATRTCQC